jgi:hypothetical protein
MHGMLRSIRSVSPMASKGGYRGCSIWRNREAAVRDDTISDLYASRLLRRYANCWLLRGVLRICQSFEVLGI